MNMEKQFENIISLVIILTLLTVTLKVVFTHIERETRIVSERTQSDAGQAAATFHVMNREGKLGEQNLEELRDNIDTLTGWNILRPVSWMEGYQLDVPGKEPCSKVDGCSTSAAEDVKLIDPFRIPLYNPAEDSFYSIAIYNYKIDDQYISGPSVM